MVRAVFQGLVLERNAIGILIDAAGEDHNTLDQAPDGANAKAEAQADLGNALAGVAQIEIVDTKAAEKMPSRPAVSLDFC